MGAEGEGEKFITGYRTIYTDSDGEFKETFKLVKNEYPDCKKRPEKNYREERFFRSCS
jgi:5-bromo-4-chloroindolyl phosphate hydrolysis protein